jgi:GTPase
MYVRKHIFFMATCGTCGMHGTRGTLVAMLIDDVIITIKAGDGGNGSASFKRNAQTPKGGPDGGNGGNGGNVYFIGDDDLNGLSQFQFKKLHKAENGVKGARQNLYGRNGADLYLKVPLGTTITNTANGKTYEIVDKITPVLVAHGGKGGRGNNEFKTAILQAPKFAEDGEKGEEKQVHLVLKLIADVGFIGLPNAGKSSLLTALTNAHPKIGAYPFTTLEPNIGMMIIKKVSKEGNVSNVSNEINSSDTFAAQPFDTSQIALADIPGLIEGAASGKGLGIKFLKHIEKTKLLVHCIDGADPEPLKSYTVVRDEFKKYNEALLAKPEIIFLTKKDLISEKEIQEKLEKLKVLGKQIVTVSIYDEVAMEEVRQLLAEATQTTS